MLNLLAVINWQSVGLVVAILAVLAIVFTALIILVGKICAVEENPKIGEVAEKLSGANCGGCGFAGCADFAKALVEGRAEVSACSATPKENKVEIAKILGQEVVETEPMFAVVKCAGNIENAIKKYDYIGNNTCEAKNTYFGGDKKCSAGCLGGGSCEAHCSFGAITVVNGVAVTNKALCTGCSVCVKGCAKHVIELIPKSASVYVACSSHCKGKDVMSACKVGCIGCGLCAKNCPNGAITMKDNLPYIDYTKCNGCLTCIEKCPKKVIKKV
jgi:Na+-translocating ferredoxin:NAD+ oxidoreductase RNF subunit RnfB